MKKPGETEETRSALIRLAEVLLQYYGVTELPVPIEQMLEEPPRGLDRVDSSQISTVIEHGLYSCEPRLGVDVSLSISYAGKFFARRLLMPALLVESWSSRVSLLTR